MAIIKKLFDLPLGTQFKYKNSDPVWVLLSRHGCGTIAKREAYDGWTSGQSICSFADSEAECRTMEVEVVINDDDKVKALANELADVKIQAFKDGANTGIDHLNNRVRELEAENARIKQQNAALVSDFAEYLYRVSSQVPFEHAEWANQRGAALLEQLKRT